MPVYEYRCPRCGVFAELAPMSAAAQPAACPSCRQPAPRIPSVPRLTTLSPALRQAHERNERSAHEPRRAARSTCGAGCGHAPHTPAPRPAGPRRPWMLGH
jgi:putative FmdB family regulatory protein